MFHRVKIEDQPKEQPAPQRETQQQPQQQNFFAREEASAPAPQVQEQRQRNFIQASESIVNQNARPEISPVQQAMMQMQQQPAPQAPVATVAPAMPAPAPHAKPQQPQAQIQTQQPQKKEAAPMNTNPAREENQNNNEQAQTRPMGIPGGYQAANQPGRSAPGGYPGAYPGYNAAKPTTGAAPNASISSGATLTIGRGITLSGGIEACEHLVVEGNVEAALKGAKLLDIAESGTFYGAVEIEKATIAGRFEGDLTVNGRLTVRSTGSITGSISYKELEVEAGAVLEGRITASKKEDSNARNKAGKDAAQATKSSREFNAQQDSNEQGLFAGKAAE